MKFSTSKKARIGSVDVRWKIDLKRGLGKSKVKNQFKNLAKKASRNFIKRETFDNMEELEISLYEKGYYLEKLYYYDEDINGDLEVDFKTFLKEKTVYKYQ